MKAVQLNGYGDNEMLEVVTSASTPTIGDGQVLVEVKAASLNALDWKIRAGYLKANVPLALPFRPGIDLAGIVIQLGSGVTEFAVGDEVYGQSNGLAGGSGAFAEQAATKPDFLAKKPRSVNFYEAAALPLAGVSALQALTESIKLQAGQKIVITGGAGGVGSLAIAIAKTIGSAVVATVRSTNDAAYALARGANEVVNVSEQKLADLPANFDAVFDTVGGAAYTEAFAILKPGGVIASMLGKDDELAAEHGVSAVAIMTQVNADRLATLATLVDDHSIKPHVTIFPIDQVRDAYAALEAGTIQGKAVLELPR